MKKINSFLSFIIVGSLLFLTNCGKDDDNKPTELTDQQKAAQSLDEGSPWQVTSVDSKPDPDIDATPLMSLQLSFDVTGSGANIAPGTFSASGAGDFLSSTSGASWSWSGSGTSVISLTGASTGQLTNVQFSPDIENPTSVKLTFVVASQSARLSEIDGEYIVTLE